MNQKRMGEEERRVEEAKKALGCVDWHKYCHAECCKVSTITFSGQDLSKEFASFNVVMDSNRAWYHKLHGRKYGHARLIVRTSQCVVIGNKIFVVSPCELLKNNLCLGHPNRKPKICKAFNEHVKKSALFTMTPNCLFKYKDVEFMKEFNEVTPESVWKLYDDLEEV